MTDLTEVETELLQKAEGNVAQATAVLCQMADSLRMIRDHRLYRKSHQTFETYCEEKWELTADDLKVILQYNG